MARTIHLRVHGLEPSDLPALQERFSAAAAARDWRGDRPWLADRTSGDLFSMEYFRHAQMEAQWTSGGLPPLSAAGFARLAGDECDALALLFILRDLSEHLAAVTTQTDRDNPIAKLRHVRLDRGRLPDGAPLESLLVARPIYKRLPGAVIEMYPPRALGSAFGRVDGDDHEQRAWSFLVHGMRDSAPDFFEAEAEAMRIYRGLRFLP